MVEMDTEVTLHGKLVSFDKAISAMEEVLHLDVQDRVMPCSEQQYIDAYAIAHERLFGKKFEVKP